MKSALMTLLLTCGLFFIFHTLLGIRYISGTAKKYMYLWMGIVWLRGLRTFTPFKDLKNNVFSNTTIYPSHWYIFRPCNICVPLIHQNKWQHHVINQFSFSISNYISFYLPIKVFDSYPQISLFFWIYQESQ